MRKILLAGAALLATTGMAMASDLEGVAISALVTASCSLTDPADITFPTNSTNGATDTRSFSFSCNFAGNNGNTLAVSFQSVNGGLTHGADPVVRTYDLEYGLNTAVSSAAIKTVDVDYPENSAAANVAELRSFKVTLTDSLPVAGTYADTLNVSVAP